MKRFILLICVCLSLFVFVGCSSNTELNSNISEIEQITQELEENRLKVEELIEKYQETRDKKYLDEADYYMDNIKRLRERGDKLYNKVKNEIEK